jgi:hypothetical protein
MISNREELQKFERDLLRKSKVNIIQNFRIVEALYREAVALRIIPMKDPLDGLEVDIKIAKVINSVSKST